jgi:isoleucyl-tRNA synthetase
MTRFEPVEPKVSFPQVERRILAFWKQAGIFAKTLEARAGAPEWIFYEGPPTANGRPGIHHAEARTFKDIYPRYKTMTGHLVNRKGGWDCHGLPVELEVEKEIGTKTKRDIEAFGIAEFNRLCRESVSRYVDDWERLTERIGFWIDMSDPYRTMDTSYIESVWWSLKRLHERDLLFEDDKVTPYCPRCGTALSDAEVALGYETVEDPSLYVQLEITESPNDPDLVGARIGVWTTTPWTLLSNLGLAVDPDATYWLVEKDGERIVVAKSLLKEALGDAWWPEHGRPKQAMQGRKLVGARYEPPYENVGDAGAHRVVAADFVSMGEGTGVVHVAPAFGPEDLELGRREGWPVYKPVDDEGRFTTQVPEFLHGRFVKDADDHIIEDLTRRGLVIRADRIEHSYPFCWRCRTPLLYYARTSWYVGTTRVKQRLLEVNESVDWYPEHIKHGRYGDWLDNNVDWALSRDRYWGTPLPIWRCPDGHATPVGSLGELSDLAGRDVTDMDPHRPFIDEVVFDCPTCRSPARRVPEVIDTWYDSGAMPFAQWGYQPDLGRAVAQFDGHFPADFICEAIDQTRGWFYTLMAEGVLHFDSTAYRSVVCLGHLVDADGRKMAKSLGNTLDPWEVLDRQGADALRWFLLTSGSPWSSRRIGHDILDEVVRHFLLTLWNVYSFFVTYANAAGFEPAHAPGPAERPVLDRWILSQLAQTVREARAGLDSYDATGAGRRIDRFVDDLSNWYVRRARRRFWNAGGEPDGDAAAAFATLGECLVTSAALLAPFVPFLSEELWRNLAAGREGAPESVHLADYPIPDERRIDRELDGAMAIVRSIVGLGRQVRTDAKVRVRQPLDEALIHFAGDPEALTPLLSEVREELNVKRVAFAESASDVSGWRAKPNFKALGPRLGPRVKEVAAALDADDGALASALARGDSVMVATSGGEVTIGPDAVDLVQQTQPGWGAASDGSVTVALELDITPELRREGLAREIVRVVQDARKAARLDVSDRIVLGLQADGAVREAADAFGDVIAAETLATELVRSAIDAPEFRQEADLLGAGLVVTLRRA